MTRGGGELEDGRTCQVAFLMKSYTEETGAAWGAQVERGSVRTFLREWLEEQGTVSPGGKSLAVTKPPERSKSVGKEAG